MASAFASSVRFHAGYDLVEQKCMFSNRYVALKIRWNLDATDGGELDEVGLGNDGRL